MREYQITLKIDLLVYAEDEYDAQEYIEEFAHQGLSYLASSDDSEDDHYRIQNVDIDYLNSFQDNGECEEEE